MVRILAIGVLLGLLEQLRELLELDLGLAAKLLESLGGSIYGPVSQKLEDDGPHCTSVLLKPAPVRETKN